MKQYKNKRNGVIVRNVNGAYLTEGDNTFIHPVLIEGSSDWEEVAETPQFNDGDWVTYIEKGSTTSYTGQIWPKVFGGIDYEKFESIRLATPQEIADVKSVKTPENTILLYTNDGFGLRAGEPYFSCHKSGYKDNGDKSDIHKNYVEAGKLFAEGYARFSTYQAAEAYLNSIHKPKERPTITEPETLLYSRLRGTKTGIHCPTQLDWDEVIQIGNLKLESYLWERYKSNSVISLELANAFGSYEYFVKEGYTIVRAFAFITANTPTVKSWTLQQLEALSCAPSPVMNIIPSDWLIIRKSDLK